METMTTTAAAKETRKEEQSQREGDLTMAKFLIQVDHDGEAIACTRTQRVFRATGSHYLTHADWGCKDGVHTAWIVVELETREQARAVLPPMDRPKARIVALSTFDEALAQHRVSATGGGERT